MKLRAGAVGAAIVLYSTPVSAQQTPVDRGVWIVGGSAYASSRQSSDINGNAFFLGLNPQLGYFVRPNLAVTANLSVSHGSSDVLAPRAMASAQA